MGDELETGDLAVVVTHHGSRPVCRVRGDIDLATGPALRKVLESFVEVGEYEIDLDLSDVEFIDSQGIAELIRARQQGLRITITAASAAVRRVLDIVQIECFIAESDH